MRNYERPDPDKVVKNIVQVLKAQDMRLLHHDSYVFLITHCGFIAHYDQQGFVAEYQDHLDDFVEFFLQGGEIRLIDHVTGLPIDQWKVALDNPRSYLYDVSYKGKVLAEVIRELIPVFENARGPVKAIHDARVKAGKVHRLETLAQEMGYQLTKKS